VLVLLAVMLLRPVWIFLMFGPVLAQAKRLTARSPLARRVEEQLRIWGRQGGPPLRQRGELPWTYSAVMSWTGMRGVVTLAAAAAVPATTTGGAPFPGRGFIRPARSWSRWGPS
jgi:CPA1 family monovalent cation:H+ antiporter